MTNLYI